MKETIKISSNRLTHSLVVARVMELLSVNLKEWSKDKAEEMFTLGFLHDIGYEYSYKQTEHAEKGGILLREMGFKYWREVYYHGKLTDEYSSDELTLLNIADFFVDHNGDIISITERLENIKNRYGENASQYNEAKILSENLKDIILDELEIYNMLTCYHR